MIQDSVKGIYDNRYLCPVPADTDTVFLFTEKPKHLLVRKGADSTLLFPVWSMLRGKVGEATLQYVFAVGARRCFLLNGAAGTELPGFAEEPLSVLRRGVPREMCFAAETAYQLYAWYRDNRFCGRCGALMQPGTSERSMLCPSCGNVVYPKISPAVIVGVTDGDRILMTRYAGREYRGHALIAGFCEIGETGEDTVRREVMEESGLQVKNIRYYKTQPWGFDSDLLLGYWCDVDGDRTITMDTGELAAAEWVRRGDITDAFEDMSLTNEMICRFRDGKERQGH
ncbi:MAG: NAD(+) diphosphatase [Lachnospiraceae bacterium]|nr:NAD(+) diphosphatase [Lachnospiraceae bacterium]